MTACLIVRAIVDSKRKDDFDIWYQKEHLPDAMNALGSMSAKRGWSIEDPNTHVAIYEFASITEASKATNSQEIIDLISEFDKHWDGFVTRTREVINLTHSM
jgi:hypothetical protein